MSETSDWRAADNISKENSRQTFSPASIEAPAERTRAYNGHFQTPESAGPSRDDIHLKRTKHGLILVPQSTDDPADPLNWPMWKKNFTLGLISISALIGVCQSITNNGGYPVQAKVYHKTITEMSYSISASIAGVAVGPLIWTPVAERIGRSSCIFWGSLVALLCNIWSALMAKPSDYNAFIVSRSVGAVFGSVSQTVGSGTIIDMYFLHERGKAFSVYTICTLFGVQTGTTLGGFVVQKAPWQWMFWYIVIAQGVLLVFIFVFLEDTTYPDRSDASAIKSLPPRSWASNRLATFFPGHRILRASSIHPPFDSLLIGICPVTVSIGLFLLLTYGWIVATATLMASYLQSPVQAGGYGFSPFQSSCFFFASWAGMLTGLLANQLLNDRVPLLWCKRFGHGTWKPEYRLFPLLLGPMVVLPLALGIFGAALLHHWHYMVLAVCLWALTAVENMTVSIAINYLAESFVQHAQETTAVLHCYWLILGLLVPFFIQDWREAVGINWVYGMQAFITIFAFGLAMGMAWKGHVVRTWSFRRFRASEEGVHVLEK